MSLKTMYGTATKEELAWNFCFPCKKKLTISVLSSTEPCSVIQSIYCQFKSTQDSYPEAKIVLFILVSTGEIKVTEFFKNETMFDY